jgi:hypothetical protein
MMKRKRNKTTTRKTRAYDKEIKSREIGFYKRFRSTQASLLAFH